MKYARLILLFALVLLACEIPGLATSAAPTVPPTAKPTSGPAGGAASGAATPTIPPESPTEVSIPPSETPTVFVPPTATTVPGVLPAPLYFVSARSGVAQVWRLEVDGVSQGQVTNAAQPVTGFDVSMATGQVAFVSGNDLYILTPSGPQMIVDGPVTNKDEEDYINKALSKPRWSPDGSKIAYGLNGVNLIAASGGAPLILRQSDHIPMPPSYTSSGQVLFYWPERWSPDGLRLLVSFAYYPEGGGMGVINPSNGDYVQITNPESMVCCDYAWSLDNLSIFYASPYFGMISAGLWRADALSGNSQTLIPGESGGVFSMPANPFQAPDGSLLYFFNAANTYPEGNVPLSMHRSAADGISGRARLRSDAHMLGFVLWSLDGGGAVILDYTAAYAAGGWPYYGPLLYLRTDGSPAVMLAGEVDPNATYLAWGK